MKKILMIMTFVMISMSVCFGAENLGDYYEDDTVYFKWNTYDSSGGSSARTTKGTMSVYKDDNVTQSTAGVTDTEDFESLTGFNHCTIVLTDAFYVAGSDYSVVVAGAVVDGQTINPTIREFSIVNRYEVGTNNANTVVPDAAGVAPTAAEIETEIFGGAVDGGIDLEEAIKRILAVVCNNVAITIADPNVLAYKNSAGDTTVVTHSVPAAGTSRTATF